MAQKVKYSTELNPEGLDISSLPDVFDTNTKVKTCGHVMDITYLRHLNQSAFGDIQRLNADEYFDFRDNKVKKYDKASSREQCVTSIKRTMQNIRDTINCNITEPWKCRWITLTYAENMTDPNRLYHDFRKFIAKLHRAFGKFEYIVVSEPQMRGAWHMHLILVFEEKAPYMANERVSSLWAQGFVQVKAMDENCDNLGAYLSAYLGDVEVSETQYDEQTLKQAGYTIKEVEIEQEGQKLKKKFVKGLRLHLYPIGMNIIRTSRGIKKPQIEYISSAEAKRKASVGALTFTRKTDIVGDSFSNEVLYFQYNMKRAHMYTKKEKMNTKGDKECTFTNSPSANSSENSPISPYPEKSTEEMIATSCDSLQTSDSSNSDTPKTTGTSNPRKASEYEIFKTQRYLESLREAPAGYQEEKISHPSGQSSGQRPQAHR